MEQLIYEGIVDPCPMKRTSKSKPKTKMQKQSPSPRVLIFPLPLQGPVNCMLKLAEIMCLENIQVTFLNTQHIQNRLFDSSNIQTYLTKKYNHLFHFETIPDGLPPEHPRTVFDFQELMRSLEAVAAPILHQMLTSGDYVNHPVTCIVADGILTFATHSAHHIGVPLLYFDTISPCCLWTYMCLPKLIQAGELPFEDENLDEAIRNVPGMEGGILRRRDLPGFCRGIDFNDTQVELVMREIHTIPLAHGLILNTFHQLDAPVLSQMLKICPNMYAIGPLHTHLQTRLALDPPINSASTSIWEEDRSCISWLDKQPPTSVVYISIGSLSVMTKEQFFELLHGVVNSGSRFLWVWRPGSVAGLDLDPMSDDGIPVELLQSRRERGCTVRWAPQQEVLAHPAVGGFLSHGGWNSTLESIVAGKPMICWPHYVDQLVNSRFVGEVWKIGLDMKDRCDRVTVEKMVREVMVLRKDDELMKRARDMSELAKSSVNQGGSAFADLDRLIQDIKITNLPIKNNNY